MKKIVKNFKIICFLIIILSINMIVFSNYIFASAIGYISFFILLIYFAFSILPYAFIIFLFIFNLRIIFNSVEQATLDVKKEEQNNRTLEQRNKRYITVGNNIRKHLKDIPVEEYDERISEEERHEKYRNDINKYIVEHNAKKELMVKKVKPKVNPYASEYYEDVLFR